MNTPKQETSTPAVAKRAVSQLLVTGTWDGARKWLADAQRCEQAKLFCQVMLGFELQALRQTTGVVNGNNQHAGRVSHDGKPTEDWETILKRETGLSQSTAYRFIDMAKAAAPRLKKIPALKDFDPTATPIAQLPEPKKEALEKAVAKLTDGLTQKQFGEEFCGWKKPSGNPNAKGAGQPKDKVPTTEDQATALRTMALEDSGRMGKAIVASNKNFFLLTNVDDGEVQAQIAVLEHALKLRRLWVATPKSKRDAAILEAVQKESPLK